MVTATAAKRCAATAMVVAICGSVATFWGYFVAHTLTNKFRSSSAVSHWYYDYDYPCGVPLWWDDWDDDHESLESREVIITSMEAAGVGQMIVGLSLCCAALVLFYLAKKPDDWSKVVAVMP